MTSRRMALGALVVAAVAIAAVVLRSGDDSIRLRAQFVNASGLRKHYAVKIAGAPVGKVTKVDLGPHDIAVAELKIERGAGPIGRDAKANLRPSNLLGEKYVEIEPGDVRHPMPPNGVIPHARTSAPTELDDVLDVLDAPTRFALSAFIAEQGKALAGRGDDLAAMLVRMPPALDRTRELVAGLARDNRALGRLVEESDRVLGSVGPRHRALGRLVESAGGAFDSLASRRRNLGDTVRRAPATIAEIHHSLVELDRTARPLAPAARGLRATAPPLTSMLRELPPFTAAARPTLRTAQKVSPSLDLLGRRAAPVVARLRPEATELSRFAAALNPATEVLDAGFPDTLGLMEGWARTISNRDAAGHVFRVGLGVENDLIARLRDEYILGRPHRRAGGRAHRRGGHGEAQPGAHSAPKPRLPRLPDVRHPRIPKLPRPELPRIQRPQAPALPPPPPLPPAAPLLDYLLGS